MSTLLSTRQGVSFEETLTTLFPREMAVGNTFGATALTSYGAFWIGLAIIFTPGGFEIATAYGGQTPDFYTALGFYLYVRACAILSWLFSVRNTNKTYLGLVHLHFPDLDPHPKVHRRLFLALLDRVAYLPYACHRIHVHHHY